MENIFLHDDYRSYLLGYVGPAGSRNGKRKKICDYLNVSSSFLTMVFKRQIEINLEQGLQLSRYFNLSKDERAYLLTLINLERAGTHELKTYYQNEIDSIKSKQINVSTTIKNKPSLDEKVKNIYYSSWIYAAVKSLIELPDYNTTQKISKKLFIHENEVSKVVDFLIENNFVQKTGSKFTVIKQNLFLSKNDPNGIIFQQNWRLKAIEEIRKKNEFNIHYSALATIRKQDAVRIKEIILEAISKNLEIIKHSDEEDLYLINMDFIEF